jgi:hypothetical protein
MAPMTRRFSHLSQLSFGFFGFFHFLCLLAEGTG